MGAAAIMEDKCTSTAAAPAGAASAACSRVGGGSISGGISHQAGLIASAATAVAGAAPAAAVCRSPVPSAAGQQPPPPCCATAAGSTAATDAELDAPVCSCPCADADRGLMQASVAVAACGSSAGAACRACGSPDSAAVVSAADGMEASTDAADDDDEDDVEQGEAQQQQQQQQLLLKLQRHPLFRDLQTALLQDCLAAPCLPSALLCALPDDGTAAGVGAGGSGNRHLQQLAAAAAARRPPYETVSRAVVGAHARVERDIASLRPWTNRNGLVLERSYRKAVAAAECQRYAALLYNCHSEECKQRINAYYDCERLALVQRVQQHLAQRRRDIGLAPASGTAAAQAAAAAAAAPATAPTGTICVSKVDSAYEPALLCKCTTAGSVEVAAAAATATGATDSGHDGFLATDNVAEYLVSDRSNHANSTLATATAASPPVQALSPRGTAAHDASTHAQAASSAAVITSREEDTEARLRARDHQQHLPRAAEASDEAQQCQQQRRGDCPSSLPLSDLPLDLSCRLTSAGCGSIASAIVAGRAVAGLLHRGDVGDHCHPSGSCIGNGITKDCGERGDRDSAAGSTDSAGEEAAAASVPASWEGAAADADVTHLWRAPTRPASNRAGGVKKRMLSKYSWESLAFAEHSLVDAAADSHCYDTSSSSAAVLCEKVKPTMLAAMAHDGGSAFARSARMPTPSTGAAATVAAAAARLGRSRATLDDVVAQCLSSQKQRKRRAASVHQQQQQACHRRKGVSGCWVVKAGACSTTAAALAAAAAAGVATGSTAPDTAAAVATAAALGTNGRLPALLSAIKLEPAAHTAFGAASDYVRLINGWPAHDVGGTGTGAGTSVLESLKRVVNSVAAVPADDEKVGGGGGRWQPPSMAQLRTSSTAMAAAAGGCEAAGRLPAVASSGAGIVGSHGSPPLMAPPRAAEIATTTAVSAAVSAATDNTAGLCLSHAGGKGSGPPQPPAGKRYLSHHARLVLNDWFLKHIRRPYPTLSEKILLAQQCGISSAKVDTWFANKRNRTHNTRKLLPKYSRLVLLKSAAAATAASTAGVCSAEGPQQVPPTSRT